VNGRIDLAQAESVLSVIQAQSDSELASALHGLDGEFSRLVRSIEEDILDLAADVEASIDFSDHDVDLVDSARLRAKVDAAIVRLDRLVACTHTQTTAHDPWTVLLYGPANAGKSTLFNRLVPGADAVVSPIAGTTRDVVYGETRWEGLDAPVRIADSAGVLENPGPLDGRALLMTHEHLKSADLILLVVDATRSEAAQPLERRLDSRPYLRVENKADLAPASRGLSVSAKTGEGMDALRAAVSDALLRRTRGGPGARFAASTRQSAALNAAAYLLRQARDAGAWGAEYAAVDLREAAQELGRVTGSHVTDEILSRIFSRFCIGK
jgi:tRNA modification GTPase